MTKKIIFSLLLVLIAFAGTKAQNAPLFAGEELFSDCLLDIPLTHAVEDRAAIEKASKEYKDVKLVFLRQDKKKKSISYGYYYLTLYKTPKITIAQLYTAADYESGKMREPLLMQYKAEYDRFYRADCFDAVLEKNPSAKQNVSGR